MLYMQQTLDTGGITWITNLGTFLLWLLQSLEICCLFGLPVLGSEVHL